MLEYISWLGFGTVFLIGVAVGLFIVGHKALRMFEDRNCTDRELSRHLGRIADALEAKLPRHDCW